MKPRGRGPRYLASVASSIATVVAGFSAAAIGTVALGACAGCSATAHETGLNPIANCQNTIAQGGARRTISSLKL